MDDATPSAEQPSRRFRRLRIATSVFFGLLTVALCLLWIASNRGEISIRGRLPGPYDFSFVFLHGSTGMYIFRGNVVDWLIDRDSDEMAFDLSGKKLVRPPIFFYRRIWFSQAYNFPLMPPIFGCGTLAAVFGFPYSFRFSLRTLLVVTTMVAIVLGLGVWLAS